MGTKKIIFVLLIRSIQYKSVDILLTDNEAELLTGRQTVQKQPLSGVL